MANENDNPASPKLGDLFKKAVTLGAGAYVSAEDKVSRTLSAVQAPKDILKEALESFFDNYAIQVQAEVKFTPKKKVKEKADDNT